MKKQSFWEKFKQDPEVKALEEIPKDKELVEVAKVLGITAAMLGTVKLIHSINK